MAEIRLTLQNRITTLMILSSILFISSFTFIQLNNQITSINRYNSYQANFSSMILKNNIEANIAEIEPQDLTGYMQNILKQLVDTEVIKKVVIFDPEGKIAAATESQFVGENVRYKDLEYLEKLQNLTTQGKWFIPEIDRLRQNLEIYLPLKSGPDKPMAFIAKVSFPLGNIQEALLNVYKPVILTVIIVIAANLLFGYLLSKTVIGPIKILNEVTKKIADGELSIRTHISTKDELEELGLTFNHMTEELIKMKERAENANPLTKLPGNIVIHENVEAKINNNQKFMVIYCDLDNFKAFNDKHGIAQGDEAIKLTAEIFKEAVKNNGNPDDFVGHEGGDDFILLTTPDKAQGIGDYITKEFDKRIRSLYTQEELDLGYIIAHARDGSTRKFPIMSISLAGVTNENRNITSYGEVTNIAAEVKKKAKDIEGSVFVVDKRRG